MSNESLIRTLPSWHSRSALPQDEEFGGFGGPHCMVKGGYGQIPQAMAAQLDVQLNSPVTKVAASEGGVSVTIQSGD